VNAHTHDDAFHEIQLNGKQLVFLVMAATVVSVAIFLCGVLVGRNVRAERSAMMQAAIAAQSPTADVLPAATPAPPVTPVQLESDPRAIAPPPTVGDSDTKSSDDAQTAAEVLKPAAPRPELPASTSLAERKSAEKAIERAQSKTVTPAAPPAAPAQATVPSAAAAASASAPASNLPVAGGYAVQVAALNARDEADGIAKRLTAKGYSAYVQVPTNGTPSVYRVRVGTFKTKREAEMIATRLQKEEQFKPWVTR
jgi:cell division septation protein DedD